ncbi:MAG: hypothetical protein M1827_003197 [Pycnora praestabilis]|nr:MAG: hypothetical protein M1827_003197 [Pycnora praestabilis]
MARTKRVLSPECSHNASLMSSLPEQPAIGIYCCLLFLLPIISSFIISIAARSYHYRPLSPVSSSSSSSDGLPDAVTMNMTGAATPTGNSKCSKRASVERFILATVLMCLNVTGLVMQAYTIQVRGYCSASPFEDVRISYIAFWILFGILPAAFTLWALLAWVNLAFEAVWRGPPCGRRNWIPVWAPLKRREGSGEGNGKEEEGKGDQKVGCKAGVRLRASDGGEGNAAMVEDRQEGLDGGAAAPEMKTMGRQELDDKFRDSEKVERGRMYQANVEDCDENGNVVIAKLQTEKEIKMGGQGESDSDERPETKTQTTPVTVVTEKTDQVRGPMLVIEGIEGQQSSLGSGDALCDREAANALGPDRIEELPPLNNRK